MRLSKPHPCRLFIFDLDGTLIDSQQDIAGSVNRALNRLHLASVPSHKILGFVGEGVNRLMQRALRETLGAEAGDELLASGAAVYQEEYARHLLDSTRLYGGVREALDRLAWAKLCVVSNKPEGFSRTILSGLGLAERFQLILGGDSTEKRKPDPEPLLHAMACCGAKPSETVMVGDSPTDILAAKAAGAIGCGISGGYRSYEDLASAGCDLILPDLISLADYFCPDES